MQCLSIVYIYTEYDRRNPANTAVVAHWKVRRQFYQR